MKIIFAGIIARYPFGGVTWCSLMYMLGLRKLGHDVHYIEDTGECIYDYEKNEISTDSTYGVNYIERSLAQFEFQDKWTYVDYQGQYFGKSKERTRALCADADLFINLSGGSWFWRDEYGKIPMKIFIDSDPAFTQSAIAKGDEWYVSFFRNFDVLFTFGRNIGADDCTIAETPFKWHTTWQPVICSEWDARSKPRDVYTTVMTWKNDSFPDADGNKNKQFSKFIDLPKQTPQKIELAVNGPMDYLKSHGFEVVEGMKVSRDVNSYRDYIRDSKAEFSVAKHLYVVTKSGWFSDRTACYLAAGRPALVQKTGFEKYLPTGQGLLTFGTAGEAVAGIDQINSDYEKHGREARELAAGHFDSDVVLPCLLQDAGIS